MFTRSILIPSLIVCGIAAPLLLSQNKKSGQANNSQAGQVAPPENLIPGNTWNTNGANGTAANSGFPSSQTNYQTAPNGGPLIYQGNIVSNPAAASSQSSGMALPTFSQPGSATPGAAAPAFNASSTMVYPGNANGPDLSAPPMEFLPVTSFEEIFRFDVSPQWVVSRWKRTSTTPLQDGLHGLRVALVTGTNSWDLHGSLTYFFDERQQLQRITFRGWAGDAKVLTNLLTQRYDFKSQPTHWAGFYLAKSMFRVTGGILMQHPNVVYRDNPIQQIAVVMEINNPQGSSVLSDEFHSLIEGSKQSQ